MTEEPDWKRNWTWDKSQEYMLQQAGLWFLVCILSLAVRVFFLNMINQLVLFLISLALWFITGITLGIFLFYLYHYWTGRRGGL